MIGKTSIFKKGKKKKKSQGTTDLCAWEDYGAEAVDAPSLEVFKAKLDGAMVRPRRQGAGAG